MPGIEHWIEPLPSGRFSVKSDRDFTVPVRVVGEVRNRDVSKTADPRGFEIGNLIGKFYCPFPAGIIFAEFVEPDADDLSILSHLELPRPQDLKQGIIDSWIEDRKQEYSNI